DPLPEMDLALRDPREVEEVVHEPRQLMDLPVDDVGRPPDLGDRRALHLEDVHRVADGCQRGPQLVGEPREELVLPALGLAQRCRQLDGLALELFLGSQQLFFGPASRFANVTRLRPAFVTRHGGPPPVPKAGPMPRFRARSYPPEESGM